MSVNFETDDHNDRMSGHADALLVIVKALNPAMIIPLHTVHPDKYRELFPNVTIFNDDE